ncbi:MAG: hypothetical protein ABEJ42_06620 [Halobacteriaceae archaeon]
METWKLLLGAAGVLVVFGAIVSVAAPDVSPPVLVGALLLLAVGAALTVRSYRFGRQIGNRMAERRDE